MGSYTLRPRSGLIWNTLKSLRPIRGGWVNRIGLRNKGIDSQRFKFGSSRIYSIVGIEPDDWEEMFYSIPDWVPLELNLGCPNVHEYGIDPRILGYFCQHGKVGVKLPATDKVDAVAEMAMEAGVAYLHCSNTIPTPRGGESGRRLKQLNLPVIERLRNRYPTVPIVAGGGIYSSQDVADYASAGATNFSLSTIWFRPWAALNLLHD